MLNVKNLTITHRKDLRVILDKFNLTLNAGDKAVIIGEEGNGKSTLMRWIYNPEIAEEYAECEGERILGSEVLGYLPQELPECAKEKTLYEYFSEARSFFDRTSKELSEMANEFRVSKDFFYAEKNLEEQIAALNEKAVEDKNDIRDNIRFDYADIETTMETLAEIEVWNRYIDTYNVESNSLGKRLETVNKLLESPYFAKIELVFEGESVPESYYIGRAAISENGYDQMVVDWRSPIAEVYYNQENGHTSYMVEDRTIPVDLKLRRQFEINKDKLVSFFDTQIAIEDPMLLKSLSQT